MIRTLVAGLFLVPISLATLTPAADSPAADSPAAAPPAAQSPAAQSPADAPPTAESGTENEKSEPDNAESATAKDESTRETRLAEYLNGCEFVGRFTLDGRDEGTLKEEEYTISRCEKLPADDMYRMTARIRYGDVNSEVPLDVKILWSGETPVITLDSFWIPGMGTFSSRVLIHRDRYSGTWQHDDKGGHLFGRIVSIDD